MDYLLQNTDPEHMVSTKQIIEYLEQQGVSAERKSVYDDIELLRLYGIDIEQESSGRYQRYYVSSRNFELPELKLLVDSVQSSKFITHMSFDPFGGMFDFNGDGKTDAFEMGLGFHIMEEMDRQSSRSSGGGSFGGCGGEDDEDDDDDGLRLGYGSGLGSGHMYDEHDMDLDMAGLSRFELELMDEDSRRDALEDAGLDPGDFDDLFSHG